MRPLGVVMQKNPMSIFSNVLTITLNNYLDITYHCIPYSVATLSPRGAKSMKTLLSCLKKGSEKYLNLKLTV